MTSVQEPEPAPAGEEPLPQLEERARRHLAQRQYPEALAGFRALVARRPEDARLWNNLGAALLISGDPGAACPALERAAALAPGAADLAFNLAQALAAAGRREEARRRLDQLLPTLQGPLRQPAVELLRKLGGGPAGLAGEIRRLLRAAEERAEEPHAGLAAAPPPAGDLAALAGRRVLHAPIEIAGNMQRLVRLLRQCGLKAAGVSYADNPWAKYQCDLNLNLYTASREAQVQVGGILLGEALGHYDLVHFHFGHSLLPELRDLPALKEAGKKIVFSFWGSDQRGDEWFYYQQARFLGHRPPRPYVLTRELMANHEQIDRHADLMFGAMGIPRGAFMPGSADTAAWDPAERDRIRREEGLAEDPQRLYILHAPSDPKYKGSGLLLPLLERCRREGLPVEVVYVQGRTPAEARRLYARADVALDQVGSGTFGLLGVEAMCWELPVMAYQCPVFDRLRGDAPLVRITAENFVDQVAGLVAMKRRGELRELGRQGRAWALAHVDLATLGIPRYLAAYRRLLEGGAVPQAANPRWHEEKRRIMAGEKSEFYRYMREEKVFDQLGLPLPAYDQSLYW